MSTPGAYSLKISFKGSRKSHGAKSKNILLSTNILKNRLRRAKMKENKENLYINRSNSPPKGAKKIGVNFDEKYTLGEKV